MSETRTFTNVGTFMLSYDYNLAGELKKITDATNMTINYGFDNAGRLSSVTGSDTLYANVSNYASNFQYRAWGGLKAMTDGKGYVSSLLYNSKLQPSHFDISGNVVSQNYDYYDDGRISFVHNTPDANFDRSYSYDQMARLTEAKSGGQARGGYGSTPYSETFGYDAFSNVAARNSNAWNDYFDDTDSASYSGNRRSGWGYDADGRNTTIGARTNTFDAAGRQSAMTAQQVLGNGNHITVNQTSGYDGDGARIHDVSSGVTTYYLRSSVLGGAIIEELNNNGQKNVGYVYSQGDSELANQSGGVATWKHNTPAGTGQYTVNSYNYATGRTELDPLGADISLTAPPDPPPNEGDGDIGANHLGGIMDARWSDFFNLSSGCSARGVAASCSGQVAMFNLKAEERAFFGDKWYDLPGNNNERERGEADYERRVRYTLTRAYGLTGRAPDGLSVFGELEAPQNPAGQKDLPSLIGQARDIIKNATGDCAKLLGQGALSAFDAIAGNIQFNGDVLVHVEGLDGGVRDGRLSDVGPTSAVTVGNQIYLNPSGWAFARFYNFPALDKYFAKIGAADQHQYALATIIHEFLHTTGKFKPDSIVGLDGKINSKQSEKYQKEVLKKCFPNK